VQELAASTRVARAKAGIAVASGLSTRFLLAKKVAPFMLSRLMHDARDRLKHRRIGRINGSRMAACHVRRDAACLRTRHGGHLRPRGHAKALEGPTRPIPSLPRCITDNIVRKSHIATAAHVASLRQSSVISSSSASFVVGIFLNTAFWLRCRERTLQCFILGPQIGNSGTRRLASSPERATTHRVTGRAAGASRLRKRAQGYGSRALARHAPNEGVCDGPSRLGPLRRCPDRPAASE
jgi:hypothetical protein